MNNETLKILEDAISDVGHWRYWVSGEDLFQIEFGGTQLYNSPQGKNSPPSGVLALRFLGPLSITALIRGEEESFDWFDKLSKDEIEPISISYEEFTLTDSTLVTEISSVAKKKKEVFVKNMGSAPKTLAFLAFWSGDVGLAIRAEQMQVLSHDGKLDAKLIKEKSSKWWTYWGEYWDCRETDSPMPQDYACEVTIPIKSE